ncbi:D-amino acid dehydrogenase [Pikeienuella sp. HZG-20]|uniref:D-amino acid dehydrogenase n=1 Tax=Paludibacillus litoralis TaxID=3133267 RepID=UPI0030ED6121
MTHIAVIGAGVAGVTTAYELSRLGFEVTVFDRRRYAAMETSFANGAQLSASNAETWTQWSMVLKGLKWMFRRDAPLLVSPRPEWRKLKWMAAFIAQIPNYRANTIETVRLALKSREALYETAEREGIDFDLEKRGIMHFYSTEADFAHGRKVNELLAEGGLERRELAGHELRQIEPALSGDFVGGFFTPSDSTGDIHSFTMRLAEVCARQGATFRFGTPVAYAGRDGDMLRFTSEAGEDFRFDGVVVCAGVSSPEIARALGDKVNIYPVKGYSITIDLPDERSRAAAPWVSLLDDRAKIVASRLGENRLRIAGTAEFNGLNRDIRADRIEPLTKWSETYFPGVSTEHATPWAGLRPMLPSMLPRVGSGRAKGVFYNTGHGHLGWTLSSATARIVAEVVRGSYAQD